MREKTIEAKLVQAVRTKGGLAPKFTSPGLDGVPESGTPARRQNRLH